MRLLILTPFRTVESFQQFVFSRILLWQLDARGIDWQLHRPWMESLEPGDFDAVLTWTYRAKLRPEFGPACRDFEERCASAGVPVINSISGFNRLHSRTLERWHRHGIPCARYQHLTDLDRIGLCYPLVLRCDGKHGLDHMHLVHTPQEARQVVSRRRREAAGSEKQLPELDLALEYVDTRQGDGYNYVWRCHVIGEEVLPGHVMRSRAPFVNVSEACLTAVGCQVDQRFLREGEGDVELVRRAAQALQCDVVAIDYGRRPDGSLIFWEANCNPKTAGDDFVPWLGLRPTDEAHGRAVVDLVLARANGR